MKQTVRYGTFLISLGLVYRSYMGPINGNLTLGRHIRYAGYHETKPEQDCTNFRRIAEEAFNLTLQPSDLLTEVIVSSDQSFNWAVQQHPQFNDDCFFPNFIPHRLISASHTGDVVSCKVYNREVSLVCRPTVESGVVISFERNRQRMIELFNRNPLYDPRDRQKLLVAGILVWKSAKSG